MPPGPLDSSYHMNPRALFASLLRENNYPRNTRNSASRLLQTLTNATSALSTLTTIDGDPDDILCATDTTLTDTSEAVPPPPPLDMPSQVLTGVTRVERAWAHWRALGAPRLVVAPMVDNLELPFRMLCRKYGAEAAYTPMLRSRIFSENEKYRSMEFTTCMLMLFELCLRGRDAKMVSTEVLAVLASQVGIKPSKILNISTWESPAMVQETCSFSLQNNKVSKGENSEVCYFHLPACYQPMVPSPFKVLQSTSPYCILFFVLLLAAHLSNLGLSMNKLR